MNVLSSMQYSIGTALDRAREAGSAVDVLVDGHWLAGVVVANDGLGIVLDNNGEEHCVVRLDQITAVRVGVRAPMLRRIPAAASDDRTHDGAMPMPGPRTPSV
jgi:hypothetical protein